MRFSAGVGWVGVILLLGSAAAAAEPDAPPAPELALLEYLGGLVEAEGQWVGPDDMRSAQALDAAVEAEGAPEEAVRE